MKNVFKVLGIIAIVAVIGFGVVSCGDGGVDKKADLKGKWIKDGDGDIERKIECGVMVYFYSNPSDKNEYYDGRLVSYNGTTVKVGDGHDSCTPISFTATIADGKMTVSGLSTAYNNLDSLTIDLSDFNGTYTKK